MSDDEGTKKSGYRLEYASSARAKCKGPKPCAGNPIEKGALRFGSLVDFRGNTSFAWRHWGCVTAKIITNMKAQFESADELDGFDELKDEDQERVRKAWEEGHVADEDVPETARKDAEDEDDEKPKKKRAAKKDAADDGPGKFKLEYASSSRSKCKDGCGEQIGKDFFRVGHEVDFRGNKSFAWQHWGCMPTTMVEKLKQSYGSPEEIEGFDALKEAEQEKVKRAWEEGAIPDDDQGAGEAVAVEKKAPAKRAKKDDGDKPVKKRARKAKKDDDDEEDEDEEEVKPARKRAKKSKADDDDDDSEEKPKPKRAPAKKAAPKAAPKKRAPAKKKDDDESAEDFAAAIDAVSGDEEEDAEPEEQPKPKRKAPAKPASKASAPPSKKGGAKPTSSRKKKAEPVEEEDDDE